MEPGYAILQFYVSLVTYTVMHMIFVISSDFVEAFSIPPLNIGIYVDKLAAIRALLMVLSDFVEWGITQKGLKDGAHQQKALTDSNVDLKEGQGARRIGSLLSFLAMLCCRTVYLYLVYKSDNKSLTVFVTLCIEGFWFGTFQMGFFAIGPEYNAFTSFGIHTMGNIIFFLQLILQHRAKKKPKINSLCRVRIHGWICLITTIIALGCWLYFCIMVTAPGEDSPSEWPDSNDVWSPLLLFIVGAFAEDFAVPGVLPFAFLDPEKANLVNYLTPSFFMTGASIIVFVNDVFSSAGLAKKLGTSSLDSKFKDWSASSPATEGQYWHCAWLLNIPKYIAFFIAMWSIHGTFDDLRCIIQSRWRVLVLTMTVVVPRATLEVAGYVGVANWAIGRGDPKLAAMAALIEKLKDSGGITGTGNLDATTLKNALGQPDVKGAIAKLVNAHYGSSIKDTNIQASEDSAGTAGKVKVTFSGISGEGESTATVVSDSKNVKVQITVTESNKGNLDGSKAGEIAKEIAEKIVEAVKQTDKSHKNSRGAYDYLGAGGADFDAFDYIAWHDVTAMFCRFVYGKFAVGYNWTRVSLGYCLPKFRPRHKGFGFGFWWWVGRTLSRAWADTVKDFKADIKCYL